MVLSKSSWPIQITVSTFLMHQNINSAELPACCFHIRCSNWVSACAICSFTWVYTVETTFVDTLKIDFPPSTHFTSAPFWKKGTAVVWTLVPFTFNTLMFLLHSCILTYDILQSLLVSPWCCWLLWCWGIRVEGCKKQECWTLEMTRDLLSVLAAKNNPLKKQTHFQTTSAVLIITLKVHRHLYLVSLRPLSS